MLWSDYVPFQNCVLSSYIYASACLYSFSSYSFLERTNYDFPDLFILSESERTRNLKTNIFSHLHIIIGKGIKQEPPLRNSWLASSLYILTSRRKNNQILQWQSTFSSCIPKICVQNILIILFKNMDLKLFGIL